MASIKFKFGTPKKLEEFNDNKIGIDNKYIPQAEIPFPKVTYYAYPGICSKDSSKRYPRKVAKLSKNIFDDEFEDCQKTDDLSNEVFDNELEQPKVRKLTRKPNNKQD